VNTPQQFAAFGFTAALHCEVATELQNLDFLFPKEYLRAALMVSLLSVWVLVGLFYYLNRFTKREYFTVWTAAWLFYALWLTLGLTEQRAEIGSMIFALKQCCVAISAVFLLWGSLCFLGLPVPQRMFGLFMGFLVVWVVVSPQVISSPMELELPVFILLGLGSAFAGVCFYRMRKKMPYIGAGMLSAGFLLWGCYLASYPFCQEYESLYSAGFFSAAVLQLFIAVSMIVLVLEEVRYHSEKMQAEVLAIRSEKEALQLKVITAQEECRSLYDEVRLSEGIKKAYEELRRTQEVVVQQERLRALGQMASGVAHDVNNALTPIVGYSDLLMALTPNMPEAASRALGVIKKSGEDIARIVARMREFYRRRDSAEPLSLININQIVEEVIELTRPRWRDLSQRQGISINIVRELAPDLPPFLGDPAELREAFTNLLFNSVDALPNGGTINFATRAMAGAVSKKTGLPSAQIQVEVRDDGVGMDEKTRQRCLEPFFSTKAKHGGTGLGLAMVYGMVQRHEGVINIESAPGKGTAMQLTFPIREQLLPTVPLAAPRAKQQRSLHLLCIDDERMIRDILNDSLKTFNHRVTVAASGKDGIELFRLALREKQPYEAVITDLGMPEMDGHQVARIIKAESPKTPIIMLTGWGTIMKEEGETAPEVDAIMAKPARIEELNDLLLDTTDRIALNA
jgi:signal transduction histidine kinase/ActR/RegA family two-component response regulator